MEKKIETLIASFRSQHRRKKNNFFFVEGEKICLELLNTSKELVQYIICIEDYKDTFSDFSSVHIVEKSFFKKYSLTGSPQGVMLLMKKAMISPPQYKGDFQVVLDRIQDPGNMGTILRTCQALNVKEIILTKGCVDIYNPKVLRASMGASVILNISFASDLNEIISGKSSGLAWLSSPSEGISCYSSNFSLKGNIIVFGNEGNGIRDFNMGKQVTIPMLGNSDSLNVAQAVTLILFEGIRKQGVFNEFQ